MPVDQKRIVELALANLEGEKSRIDAEIADLRAQLGGKKVVLSTTAKPTSITKTKAASASSSAKTNGRFVRTAAQKAKTASAMKALWVKVRKAGFNNIKDYQASLKKG